MTKNLHIEIAESLRAFQHLPCVGGKLYLGSMFYIDFGGTFRGSARSGTPIDIGEMTLSVRDVDWRITYNQSLTLSANYITGANFANILVRLEGLCMTDFSQSRDLSTLDINFEDDVQLSIDLTNRFRTDSDIVEFALPDGRILTVNERAELVTDLDPDVERAQHWRRSPRHS